MNLSLSSDRRETLETLDTECLWTEIKLPKTCPILIASVYRTPPKTDSSLDALERTFVLANETGNEIIILGDMNLDLLPIKKKGLVKKLTNLHRVLQFKQLVTKPTRVTEHSRTLIDRITTNRDNYITHTDVQSTGLSDHRMVYTVRMATKPRLLLRQIQARTYRRFDPDAFIYEVSTAPWINVYEQPDVDSAWKVIFLRICDKHAPYKNMTVRGETTPWVTYKNISFAQERDYFKRKAESMGDPELWSKYRTVRNYVNNLREHLRKRTLLMSYLKIKTALENCGVMKEMM